MSNEEEIWMPIKDVPYLEISSFGRARTLDRYTKRKREKGRGSGMHFAKGRILKPYIHKTGNCTVSYNHDESLGISLAVAKTFIPNPENKKYVKHIDGDKSNNNINNLEWTNECYKDKLNMEERKRAVDEYLSGKQSHEEIAVKYNVNRKTIGNWVKKFGKKSRSIGGWRDFEIINSVAQEYKNGARTYQLAEKYNICSRTVSDWVKETGGKLIPIEEKLGYTEELKKRIVDLYNNNLTCCDIAELLNVKRSFVYEIIRKWHRANKLYCGIKIKGGRGNYVGTKGSIETRFGIIRYDSLYERDRIIYNSRDNNIKNMQRCKIQINYKDDSYKSHAYRPDFFIENIDNSFVIEEVKPTSMLNQYNNQFKHESAIKYCKEHGYVFRVITEKEIYGKR